mgnify:CR=1 FL=1
MLITKEIAIKVRKKRAVECLGKVALAKKLGVTPPTLGKVERGDLASRRNLK